MTSIELIQLPQQPSPLTHNQQTNLRESIKLQQLCSCNDSNNTYLKNIQLISEEEIDSGVDPPSGSVISLRRFSEKENGFGRSRSVPGEEFKYLIEKLKELERTDSALSARTRDSGFTSEQEGSFAYGSFCASMDEHTSNEIPSAIFGCNGELHSGMLENYGLNGPLVSIESRNSCSQPAVLLAATSVLSGSKPIGILRDSMPSNHHPIPSSNNKRKANEDLKQGTIRQHYYPEGGWGYIIVLVSFLVQVITHGLQMSFGVLLPIIIRRFEDKEYPTNGTYIEAGFLGGLSISLSLMMSPVIVGICRRKSTRLSAVIGGLIAALGCLFTSFANQFHQLYFSYGIVIGIGVGMTRDTAALMVGQYFKRKREFFEIIVVGSTGAGIATMSALILEFTSSIGWRLGLQIVAAIVSLTFILGTFYRSASLYHPQRRAILHLKTQKKKIKNKDKEKNKIQEDVPPFFEFTALKSRTVQIMLASTFIAFIGLNTPVIVMCQMGLKENLNGSEIRLLQVHFGLAFIVGCIIYGIIIVANSKECRIARQYLCQTALVLAGIAILSLLIIKGYNGYLMFVWIYGIGYGGYIYAFKMFIFEKVRARNFARSWSFAQFSMGIANIFAIPLSIYLNEQYDKMGFVLSGVSVLLASLTLSFIDVHKHKLRQKKKQLQHSNSTATTFSNFASSTCQAHPNTGSIIVKAASSTAGLPIGVNVPEIVLPESDSKNYSHKEGIENEHYSDNKQSNHSLILNGDCSYNGRENTRNSKSPEEKIERQLSFSDHDDIIPPISLLNQQRSFIIDHPEDDLKDESDYHIRSDLRLMSNKIPDNLLIIGEDDLEELDYYENITSCNKVENCVILSEFEQNLNKEKEEGNILESKSEKEKKKWKLFRNSQGEKKRHKPTFGEMPVIEENSF